MRARDHGDNRSSSESAARSPVEGVGKQTLTGTISRQSPVEGVGKRTLTETISRHGAGHGPPRAGDAVEAASSSSGHALPGNLRSSLEGSLGEDLSSVRVHTGATSVAAAASINANAYTTGRDIHFAEGRYDPGSRSGQHLIAHEVAHTVQQGGGIRTKLSDATVSTAADAHEVEADRFADAFSSGQQAGVQRGVSGMISRDAPRGGGEAGDIAAAGGDGGAIPADIAGLTKAQCIDLVTHMWLGQGKYDHRGVIDHKIDAVTDMQTAFQQSEPVSLESKLLIAAIAIGAGAAAGGLGVVFAASEVASALIWGANGLITSLPNFFGGSDVLLNPLDFTSNYRSSLREGWPQSIEKLHAKMTDDASARRIAAAVKRVRDDHAAIKQNQKAELLDEWTNATLAKKTDPKARGGMGDVSYDDPTEGRLHLGGSSMWIGGSREVDSTPRFSLPSSATMEGVPGPDARNVNLSRTVGSIPVARTMDIGVTVFAGKAGAQRGEGFAVAMTPNGSERIEEGGWGGMSMAQAKAALASYSVERALDRDDALFEGDHDQELIDSKWESGLTKVWNQVRNKKISDLGVTQIGM